MDPETETSKKVGAAAQVSEEAEDPQEALEEDIQTEVVPKKKPTKKASTKKKPAKTEGVHHGLKVRPAAKEAETKPLTEDEMFVGKTLHITQEVFVYVDLKQWWLTPGTSYEGPFMRKLYKALNKRFGEETRKQIYYLT